MAEQFNDDEHNVEVEDDGLDSMSVDFNGFGGSIVRDGVVVHMEDDEFMDDDEEDHDDDEDDVDMYEDVEMDEMEQAISQLLLTAPVNAQTQLTAT